jgi:hypothetical protein
METLSTLSRGALGVPHSPLSFQWFFANVGFFAQSCLGALTQLAGRGLPTAAHQLAI